MSSLLLLLLSFENKLQRINVGCINTCKQRLKIVMIKRLIYFLNFLLLFLVTIPRHIIFVSVLWVPKLKSFTAGSFHILWSALHQIYRRLKF